MLAGEPVTIHGDGEQSRDFTYIDNVVHGNLLAASAPAEKVSGQMMNVATGSRATLNQTFALLKDLTGLQGRADLRRLPRRRYSRLAGGYYDRRKLLGYEPQVDFREGLRRTVEWYKTVPVGA